MMSGPYQSNILRFLVGQYRAGVDRHRRAVMTTQSTVALGVEVGSVLAMTPVYAAVRMSQSAKRKLRQSMTNRRWLEPLTKVVGQLKYSGVGGLVVRSRLSVTDDAEAKKTAGVGLQATGVSVYRIIAQSAVKAMGIVRAAVGWVVPVDAVEEDESAIAPSSTPSDIVQPNSAHVIALSLVKYLLIKLRAVWFGQFTLFGLLCCVRSLTQSLGGTSKT